MPRISMRLLQPFVALAQRRGSFVPAALETTRAEDHLALSVAMDWLEASPPELGLRALSFVERGSCDVTEYVAASARTWGEALEHIRRYARLLHEAADFSLHKLASKAMLELRSHVALARPLSEFQAGLFALAARSWLGHLDGFEFCFAHDEPHSAQHYRAVFGPQVRFGAACDAVLFDAKLLDAPLRRANRQLHLVLRRHADYLLSAVPEPTWLTSRVRQLVMELLPEGKMDIRYTAAKLQMSRRTLGRHLKREGTTYRDLVESARHELACQYLLMPRLDVKQIALLLGYSETTAFSRAFKRWCGLSPVEYRRRRAMAHHI